tara:strand:- start:2639 stop:2788 length:150 start_codon:yes stop_codon:yes gene_type:complete
MDKKNKKKCQKSFAPFFLKLVKTEKTLITHVVFSLLSFSLYLFPRSKKE